MSIPFIFYYFLIKIHGSKLVWIVPIIWVSFEIIFSNLDIAWPWLTIGNSLGNSYYLIQWYKFFGVYSGTLWLLYISIILYLIIYKNKQLQLTLLLVLTIPISLSLLLYTASENKELKRINLTIYKPSDLRKSNYKRTKDLYKKVKKNDIEEYLLIPELFLTKSNYFTNIYKDSYFYIDRIFQSYPEIKLIYGNEYVNGEKLYNTLIFHSKDSIKIHKKEKYVPFREYIPKNLEFIFGKSYYDSSKENALTFGDNKITTLLCYESVFSIFVAKKSINKSIIFVLSSEEFMNGSLFGKKQYDNLMRIIAIENNKYVIKNSYQGNSFIVNSKGKITQRINNEITNINVPLNNENTIYQKIINLF
jgi:apolipoprotein N-acyltransferase